jgi:hypothetical protein
MAQAPRIPVPDARAKVQRDEALLVCAYDDEQKCAQLRLPNAISLKELVRRLPTLPKTQELIFYCA